LGRKEVKVTFRTITPLWTGDAWQENKEIRPSSLIGSLRFWFEVICYFSGVVNKEYFTKQEWHKKKINVELFGEHLKKCGNNFKCKIEALLKQNIPIPAIIFGTTGWRSLIEIKGIEYDEKNFKENPKGKILPDKNWRWGSPSYQGSFEVTFLVEENILDSVFYPLLTFMDKYGFWGGKWNIGYGRLNIENIRVKRNGKWIETNNWSRNKIILEDFSIDNDGKYRTIDSDGLINKQKLNKDSKPFEFLKQFLSLNSFYCKTEREFKEKSKIIPVEIRLIEINNLSGKYSDIIKGTLEIKNKIRDCLRHICEEKEQDGKSKFKKECFENGNFQEDKEINCEKGKYKCEGIDKWRTFRHKLLGELREGSKIFPLIYKENNQLKGCFISIAGLLNLEGGKDA